MVNATKEEVVRAYLEPVILSYPLLHLTKNPPQIYIEMRPSAEERVSTVLIPVLLDWYLGWISMIRAGPKEFSLNLGFPTARSSQYITNTVTAHLSKIENPHNLICLIAMVSSVQGEMDLDLLPSPLTGSHW